MPTKIAFANGGHCPPYGAVGWVKRSEPNKNISSCGNTIEHAKEMLNAAVRLFLEEAEKMETLADIMEESRYKKDSSGRWLPPKRNRTISMYAFI